MRDERGFTLLEVIVALVIAAMALGVLFRVGGEGMTSVRAADSYDEAVSRARSHLAALGRDPSLLEGDSAGDDGGGYAWHLHVAPIAAAQLEAGQPQPGAPQHILYAVEVTISWRDQMRPREVTLRTERFRKRTPH
jgi:general secretion pathway protein I